MDALRSGVALGGFLGGVTIGASIVRQGKGEDIWPFRVTAAIGLEMVVLFAFALVWAFAGQGTNDGALYFLIALAALAMGNQSVTVRSLGVKGVTTTYITGTWTSLVSDVVHLFHGARSRSEKQQDDPQALTLGLQAAVLGVYFPAAVGGGLAAIHWRLTAGIPPVVVVGLVVAAACFSFSRSRASPDQKK